MADVNGVDERIAHQTADQADHTVGGQDAGRGEAVARDGRALDVVHRLDEVVDTERNRGDENDAKEFKSREHHAERGQRQRESEIRHGCLDVRNAHAAEARHRKFEGERNGDSCAGGEQCGASPPALQPRTECVRTAHGPRDALMLSAL